MKIFSAVQIRQWDQYTIINEPIASPDLMERAAASCFKWINANCDLSKTFIFFCGNGNNGGDGLAIARMLHVAKLKVSVYILKNDNRTADCNVNLSRLKALSVPVDEMATDKNFPEITAASIIIDALFGSGLNKPLQGLEEKLVQHINASKEEIISIDLPSGLFADDTSIGNTVIKATTTLSFQTYKLAFLLAENEDSTGNIYLLDIGLHCDFYQNTKSNFTCIDKELIQSIYKPRKKFTHKYSYGHALLYAGSTNMMGAAILCAKACLRSGAGLVTVYAAGNTSSIIHTALPEALTTTENDFEIITKKKAAIGIGPGLALTETNSTLLKYILINWDGNLVIDAAALHLLVPLLDWFQLQPHPAILTPHTGEFKKLFGNPSNDFERLQMAIKKAALYHCYVIVKGHHSMVVCPDGEVYFNTTGNSGMATAGSGDVLTGIITGLLAQGYTQKNACLMGVYLHGLAGDFAAEKFSQEAMIAGDITDELGAAYKTFQ
jgi:ADP-dependent NAD(P)H-hydrate dehydratase / NAD(P)H-hydrate epimerase